MIMKINNNTKLRYSNNVYFYAKYRYSNLVDKLSSRDIYSDTKSEEFVELRNIYNNLWKQLGLHENLKPRIQYKAMLSNMAFSIQDYKIYVEKRLSPFKMNLRNKSGKNESILRHEIEHVKQIWDIVRLVGADNMTEELNTNMKWLNIEVSPSLLKKFKEIEKFLGKISPLSTEGIKAQQYLEALRNYPDTSQYYGISIKELLEYLEYKNNLLEKEARNEAAKYKPKWTKTLKIAIKEFIKLLK